MKELDKNVSYDLRDLNESQLREFKRECVKQGATPVFDDYFSIEFKSHVYSGRVVSYRDRMFMGEWFLDGDLEGAINALTLFEPELKIGDTFEYNGFICEVKEEVKKWYRLICKNSDKTTYETHCSEIINTIKLYKHIDVTEITDKDFIKLLNEYSK